MPEMKTRGRVAIECTCGWEHCDDYRVVEESQVRPGDRVLGPWRESGESDADYLARRARWKSRK